MMKSSEMPAVVPKAMPSPSATFEAVRFISIFRTPRFADRSTRVRRLTSPCPTCPTATFALTSGRFYPGNIEPLGGARFRTAADSEQRDSRGSHDEEQFVGAVPHGSQPHDEHHGSRHGRKGHADRRQDDRNGQRDEADRERAEEALDPLFHDEHPGPSDVPVHAGEGDERQSEETAEGREETDEAERDEGVCHARSDALILGGLLPANKHIVLNVPFWDLSRHGAIPRRLRHADPLI